MRHLLLREVLNTYLIRDLFLQLVAYIVVCFAPFLHLLRRCDQILLCLALVGLRVADLRRLFSFKQLLRVLILLVGRLRLLNVMLARSLHHFICRRGE